MRSKFKWIFTLLLALSMQFSFAQEKTVTGVVSDELGPAIGATVIVKGTKNVVVTDFDGKYSIKAKSGDVLEVSYFDMKQIVTVGVSNSYNVTLKSVLLKEVVVVAGYKTETKAKSIGASTVVSSETIENRPNVSAIQTLQGQVAGFNIITGSGQPGEVSNTLIRGVGSVNGNTEPLYVIDGVPQSGSSFRAINSEDIESINVLRDAVATSIYGNRGGNGVVIVTTKKGKLGKSEVIFTSTTGVSVLQNQYYDKMSSQELLRIEKAKGTGFGNSLTDQQINSFNTNTDWFDVLLRTAFTQNVNLSFSNGNEKMRSFNSISYNQSEGLAQVSKFRRITFRNNSDGKALNDKLEYSTNISLGYVMDDRVPSLGTGGVNQNPLLGSLVGLPYLSPSDYQNGRQLNELVRNRIPTSPYTNTLPLLGYTPLLIMDLNRNVTNRRNEFQIFGSTSLKYNFSKNFNVKNVTGIDYTQFNTLNSQGAESFNAVYFAENDGKQYGGFQSEGFSYDSQITNTLSFNFNESFNKHAFNASVFTEVLYGRSKAFSYEIDGLNPISFYPGDGSGFVPEDNDNDAWYNRDASSGLSKAMLLSYFGFVDYDYDSKFGLSATVRRDGTYRFLGDNKFGNFWSIGGRINLDKFSFLENSDINMLKLRVSYGTVGNQNILGQSLFAAPNSFLDLYNFGNSYNQQIGAFPTVGNPDVRWEEITTANFGVDLIFKNNLRVNLDIYQKQTDNLYLPIPTSSISSVTSITGNFGKLRNSGVELQLSYDLINSTDKSGLKLNLFANGSYNKNEFIDLPQNEVISGNSIRRIGGPVGEFYIYKYAGINPNSGNHLFYTNDGQLTETPDNADRYKTGKTSVPVFQGGFGFNLDYNNFYLSTQFNFIADVYRFDYDLASFSDPNSIGQFNLSRDLLNYWTPSNRYTDQPSLNVANQGFAEDSERFLIDASYLRLRNIQFGYNFPKSTFNDKLTLKLFAQVENLYTWSKWRGWDAESPRGGDNYQFPTPRLFTIGAQINL